MKTKQQEGLGIGCVPPVREEDGLDDEPATPAVASGWRDDEGWPLDDDDDVELRSLSLLEEELLPCVRLLLPDDRCSRSLLRSLSCVLSRSLSLSLLSRSRSLSLFLTLSLSPFDDERDDEEAVVMIGAGLEVEAGRAGDADGAVAAGGAPLAAIPNKLNTFPF
jgi:hypothetical protein